jgi:hypothetical protein
MERLSTVSVLIAVVIVGHREGRQSDPVWLYVQGCEFPGRAL